MKEVFSFHSGTAGNPHLLERSSSMRRQIVRYIVLVARLIVALDDVFKLW